MANKNKTAQITFRATPQVKADLEDLADLFDLDVNGLLNMVVDRNMAQWRAEAAAFQEKQTEADKEGLFRAWRAKYPSRKRKEFIPEYFKLLMGETCELDGLKPLPARRRKPLPSLGNDTTAPPK
jgi:hypothetical protein